MSLNSRPYTRPRYRNYHARKHFDLAQSRMEKSHEIRVFKVYRVLLRARKSGLTGIDSGDDGKRSGLRFCALFYIC